MDMKDKFHEGDLVVYKVDEDNIGTPNIKWCVIGFEGNKIKISQRSMEKEAYPVELFSSDEVLKIEKDNETALNGALGL